jgi:hypothetical protein
LTLFLESLSVSSLEAKPRTNGVGLFPLVAATLPLAPANRQAAVAADLRDEGAAGY